jgi:hypothetical protein
MPNLETQGKQEVKKFEKIKSSRSNIESRWDDVIRYVALSRRKSEDFKYSRDEEGYSNTDDVLSSLAPNSARDLATLIDGLLTPSSQQWFSIGVAEEEIMADREARAWFQAVDRILFQDIYNPQAMFKKNMAEMYFDAVTFGLYNMYVEKGTENVPFRFRCRDIMGLYVEENNFGVIDQVYYEFMETAENALARSDWNIQNPKIIKCADKNPTKKFKFLHIIKPRKKYNPSKVDNLNMPFESVWIDMDVKEVIGRGGYREMPNLVGRWKTRTGELYPDSPALIAMPDIKMHQSMVESILVASEVTLDPPYETGNDDPADLSPGGHNYKDPRDEGIKILNTVGNISFAENTEFKVAQQIRNAFFLDKFDPGDTNRTEKTAFEVQVINNRQMTRLEPMLSGFESDQLNPLLRRCFFLNLRSGRFPQMPDILLNNRVTLDIKYRNPFTKSLEERKLEAVMATYQGHLALAQADPAVMDNLDFDKISSIIGVAKNTPVEIYKTDKAKAQMRQQRAEAQQAEEQKQNIERASAASVDVAKAQNMSQ